MNQLPAGSRCWRETRDRFDGPWREILWSQERIDGGSGERFDRAWREIRRSLERDPSVAGENRRSFVREIPRSLERDPSVAKSIAFETHAGEEDFGL